MEFQSRPGKGKTIERRTQAHHHEASLDVEWPGFVQQQLCRWMIERLGHQTDEALVPGEANAATPEPPAHTAPAATRQMEDPEREPPPACGEVQTAAGARALDWQIAAVRLSRPGHPGAQGAKATLFECGRFSPAAIESTSHLMFELVLEKAHRADPHDERARLQTVRLRAHHRGTGLIVELGQAHVPAWAAGGSQCTLQLAAAPFAAAGDYRLECLPVAENAELPSLAIRIPLLLVLGPRVETAAAREGRARH